MHSGFCRIPFSLHFVAKSHVRRNGYITPANHNRRGNTIKDFARNTQGHATALRPCCGCCVSQEERAHTRHNQEDRSKETSVSADTDRRITYIIFFTHKNNNAMSDSNNNNTTADPAPVVRKVRTAFLFYQADQLSKIRAAMGLSMGDAMTEVSFENVSSFLLLLLFYYHASLTDFQRDSFSSPHAGATCLHQTSKSTWTRKPPTASATPPKRPRRTPTPWRSKKLGGPR